MGLSDFSVLTPGNTLALTAAALMIEAVFGYPTTLFSRIRHPVVWMGALLSGLDRRLNNPAWSFAGRRVSGVVALGVLLVCTAAVTSPFAVLVGEPGRLAVDRDAGREPACPAKSRRPCGGRRGCPRCRRPCGGQAGRVDDRRPQSDASRRSWSRPRRDRKPGREFLGRDCRSGLLACGRGAPGRVPSTRRSTRPIR